MILGPLSPKQYSAQLQVPIIGSIHARTHTHTYIHTLSLSLSFLAACQLTFRRSATWREKPKSSRGTVRGSASLCTFVFFSLSYLSLSLSLSLSFSLPLSAKPTSPRRRVHLMMMIANLGLLECESTETDLVRCHSIPHSLGRSVLFCPVQSRAGHACLCHLHPCLIERASSRAAM